MDNTFSEFTQYAYNNIDDDDLVTTEYLTPGECFEYLADDSNFKSLSDVLTEAMIKNGLCSIDDPVTNKIDILYKLLHEQAIQCPVLEENNKTLRLRIRRWFSGEIKSIRTRFDAIAICFALKLTLKSSTDLLNKIGFNGFNVRNAEDATYMYCILNNRPLSVALDILNKFQESTGIKTYSPDLAPNDHSGNTTILLKRSITENFTKENDDEFLNSYLISNKEKFIGYVSTEVNEYYKIKNRLMLTVLTDTFKSTVYLLSERIGDAEKTLNQKEINLFLSFRSALRKCSDPSHVLKKANDILMENMSNSIEVILEIAKIADEHIDLNSQKQISVFLNDVIKMEGFLKYVISSIRSTPTESNSNTSGAVSPVRLRKYSESVLKESVMKEFPTDRTFMKFERDPAETGNSLNTRKAIILMYYIAYAYEFTAGLSDPLYTSPMFGDIMGFYEFVESLDNILLKCNLATLYPANQFDWLIMRSIRDLEINDPTEDGDTPIAFFNTVLAFSFGEGDSDEDLTE